MPTLFYSNGCRFFFYSDEHLPEHVHVENGDGRAKIVLTPEVKVVSNNGIKKRDLSRIVECVSMLRLVILENGGNIMDNVTDMRSDLKIKRVWFKSERIFMESEDGEVYSRPLEAFPSLKNATVSQRENYEIGKWGDDIRWPAIDEDIHVSSFWIGRNRTRIMK